MRLRRNPESASAPGQQSGNTSISYPMAVEFFGEDAVNYFLDKTAEIKKLDELASLADPFLEPGENEVDLSGIDQDVQDAIVNYHDLRTLRSAKKIRENELVVRMIKPKVSKKRVTAEMMWHMRFDRRTAAAVEGLGIIEEEVESSRALDTGPLDADSLEAIFGKISHTAAVLPSPNSIQVLKNLGLLSRDEVIFNEIISAGILIRTPGLLKKDNDLKLKGADKVDQLAKRVGDVRRWGSQIFKQACLLVNQSHEINALAILTETGRLSAVLNGTEGIEPEAKAEAQAFLSEQAQLAEQTLKRISSGVLADRRVREQFEEIKNSPRQTKTPAAEGIAGASELSRQITEARDIIVGGRRLGPTKKVNPGDIALKLEDLLDSDGQRLPVERGLIIAALTDRFSSFVDTVTRVQSQDRDKILKAIETERKDVIRLLRDVDLQENMLMLELILEQYEDQLTKILTEDGFWKVKKSLANFYGRQADSGLEERNIEPASKRIEEFLPASELIGELDWTVLPYGEEGEQDLEEAANAIVELARKRAAKGTKIELDLSRLEILRMLRRAWGPDRCHYERGTLKDRGVRIINGEEQPDEYIILVMQLLNEQGGLIGEHAVAESPITRDNALYVFRADTEISKAFNWRQVYSVRKEDARDIGGARAIKHTKGDGRPHTELLPERVLALLTCPPEQFYQIRFDRDRIRLVRNIGSTAV